MIVPDESYDSDLHYLAPILAPNVVNEIKSFVIQIDETCEHILARWKDQNNKPFFNVKALDCFQNEGYNIYRLRPLGTRLTRYRIVYAYDNEYDDFYLLAVTEKPLEISENKLLSNLMHNRIYNYEPDHHITKRIKDDYDRLHIPKVR